MTSCTYTPPLILHSIKLHAKNKRTLGENNIGEIETKAMERCYQNPNKKNNNSHKYADAVNFPVAL